MLFSQGGVVKASTSEDGGAFGPPETVATPSQLPLPIFGGKFALAGAGEGSAVALWPVGGTVQTAALHATMFDATPPTLPSIQVPAAPLTVGVPAIFTASAADDWSTPVVSWAFSDGVQLAGSTVQRAFPSAGTFTATAWATDAVANTATAVRTVTVVAAPVGPSVVPSIANDFNIGKTKLNKKKGTAKVLVTLPGPGKLVITGNGVAKQRYFPKAAGLVKALVKAKGKKADTLNFTGKVRLKVKFTYTPTGGVAKVKIKRVTLKKNLG